MAGDAAGDFDRMSRNNATTRTRTTAAAIVVSRFREAKVFPGPPVCADAGCASGAVVTSRVSSRVSTEEGGCIVRMLSSDEGVFVPPAPKPNYPTEDWPENVNIEIVKNKTLCA